MLWHEPCLGPASMPLQFGIWAPVCVGWLRVRDPEAAGDRRGQPPGARENPAVDAVALAGRADQLGYDYCYIPEHYLNAVHGPEHDVADGWTVAAAAVARTRRIQVVTAVQPGFRWPGVVAKMAATLEQLRPGSIALSLIAGWWRLEAESYGDLWLPHADRYARLSELADVIRGLWTEPQLDYAGRFYRVSGATLRARPAVPPPIYVAGESAAALELCARTGDYLFVNGAHPERVHQLATTVKTLARERYGRSVKLALSALAILRDSDGQAQARARALAQAADRRTIDYFSAQMDGAVVAHNRGTSADLIDANLGLSSGLVGDAHSIRARLRTFQQAGVDAVAVKLEPDPAHADRFAAEVIGPYRHASG